MEDECFPAISINSTSSRGESSSPLTSSSTSSIILKRNNLVPEDNEYPEIKGEPISAPASPCAPCQPNCDMVDDTTITMVSPESFHFPKTHLSHTSDSEEDDEDYQVSRLESILRQSDRSRAIKYSDRFYSSVYYLYYSFQLLEAMLVEKRF